MGLGNRFHGGALRAWLLAALVLALALVFAVGAHVGASASTGGVGTSAPQGEGRQSASGKYERIWDRFTRSDKRWAHSTARCESGRDPNAIGGGGAYRGAFQFLRSTWKTSPKSPGGDPIDYPYRTQAVVAVLLKHELGSSPWPVCG
jgi:Transglycosylase-like domain